ncbi:hypothetical protein HK102_011510 [Quaeritorhiza haematococci]|nr:hypothetical protein HK102_011510 [Quaeritorhiza haematococci]
MLDLNREINIVFAAGKMSTVELDLPPPPSAVFGGTGFDGAKYVEVVNDWLLHGYNSLPTLTPLDCLEYRLLKIFFLDFLYVGDDDDLTFRKKANYIMCTLLRLSQRGDRNRGNLGDGEVETARQFVSDKTTAKPDESKQLVVGTVNHEL